MNLELIRKYEKEFLHMLHGGKLMFKPNDKHLWFDSISSPIDWTIDGLYVIDDIYCTYRKALAEGKIVEANYNKWVFPKIPTKRWDTMAGEDFDRYGIDDLRIKPEEPEFKIGDYVRYIHANSPKPLQIVNINFERYYFENAEIILRLDEIEKWEPREGEVCIFWSDGTYSAVIGIFSNMNQEKYVTITTQTWSNCMPFTGILPPHMKENK